MGNREWGMGKLAMTYYLLPITHYPLKKMTNRPIAIDLFAGAGGMTLGFEMAGFDVQVAVELDPIHCATHQFNFPFWSVLCRSVAEVTGEDIRRAVSLGDRQIDVIFGGPPCQGFSQMGKRALDDPRNELMLDFIRLVSELKPKYFVIENVKGLTGERNRNLLDKVRENLENKDYEILKPYQVLNAANYGVPQSRERLFLLGAKKGLKMPMYPEKITANPRQKRKISDTKILPNSPTVREAIADLPDLETHPELFQQDWLKVEYGEPSDYAKKSRNLDFWENDYSYPRDFDSTILTGCLRTKHSQNSIDRFAATLPGKSEPKSRFHKLDAEGISNTLRAGTPSNRGAYTSPRPIHPFKPRCITVREAARLHSYPDWFRFHRTKWHGFRQIGNSVPPLLAKAIATEIIKVLGCQLSKPTFKQPLGDEKWLKFNMVEAANFYGVDSNVIEPRKRGATNN
jgi:DNA (cytosine-5)-methyltransferase 1